MKKQKNIVLLLFGIGLVLLCTVAVYALNLSSAAKMGAVSLFSLGDIYDSAQTAASITILPAEDEVEVVPPAQPEQPATPKTNGSAQTTASITILPAEDGAEVIPPVQPATPKTNGSAQTTASITILPAETK